MSAATDSPPGPLPAPVSDAVLEVRGLTVEFDTEAGTAVVVQDVDLTLERGRTLGLVGESGSGKTVTSLAVLGLIGRSGVGRVTAGTVMFDGRDLLTVDDDEIQRVRGNEIAMIFQEPRRSLDPVFTVGYQIAEVARQNLGLSKKAAWLRAVEMLDVVGIPEPARRAKEYPDTFSGGMCQRVMLAMALVSEPRVLIADEPTTALDVTVQAQVLRLLHGLRQQFGLAVLFITHDLGVVAEVSDRVSVMYAGQVVENASVRDVFHRPRHPYTEGLLGSLPQAQQSSRELRAIPGVVPPAHSWPSGCRFHPRCQYVVDACIDDIPELRELGVGHVARCARAAELTLRGVR